MKDGGFRPPRGAERGLEANGRWFRPQQNRRANRHGPDPTRCSKEDGGRGRYTSSSLPELASGSTVAMTVSTEGFDLAIRRLPAPISSLPSRELRQDRCYPAQDLAIDQFQLALRLPPRFFHRRQLRMVDWCCSHHATLPCQPTKLDGPS